MTATERLCAPPTGPMLSLTSTIGGFGGAIMLMQDRVVLITGASRGIGAATARLLGRHGASVIINYKSSKDDAALVAVDILETGAQALAVRADVREPDQVWAMVEKATAEVGPIDTLVLNAGIDFPVKPFMDIPWEEFEAKLVGEIKAACNCVKAVVPTMIERNKGCIIAISSGLSRHPGHGFSAHSTAKSGLDALMKSLALELGPHGIRVNVIAPGLTLTDATAHMPEEQKAASAARTPLGRNASPEDVAGAVLALATAEAGFVSGAYLPVSGGSQII